MTTFRIHHQTAYEYESAASLSYNEARLLPRHADTPLYRQHVLDTQVQVEPGWNDHSERVDFFGNRVLFYTIRQPHAQMCLTAVSQVKIVAQGAAARTMSAAERLSALIPQSPTWEEIGQWVQNAPIAETFAVHPYVLPSPYIPQLKNLQTFAQRSFHPKRSAVAAALELMQQIFSEFEFVAGATDVATPLAEVLEERKGVCQDFAHLMVGALRAQGLAARYMSGYIETLPPPGQEKLVGSDASHAWCSLYVPRVGWVDFDPTNNLIPTEQHVVLGWGRDFGDVTPLKGVFYGPNEQTLDVSVDMQRVADADA